jgi:hypothetical protein
MTLSMRPATAEDRPRIRRWLALAAARSWLGDAPGAEARVILAMGSAVALCRMVEEEAVPIGYGHAAEAALWAGSLPAIVAPGTWEIELFIAAPPDVRPQQRPASGAPLDVRRGDVRRGSSDRLLEGTARRPLGAAGEPLVSPPAPTAALATTDADGGAAGEMPGETPQGARPCAAEALALLADEVFATTLALACCGLVPVTNEAAARAYERARFRWQRIWHDPVRGPTWVMLRERPH